MLPFLALSLIASLLPSTAIAADAAGFDAEAHARGLVARLNAAVGTKVEFVVRHRESIVDATPSGGNGDVAFADADLAAYSLRPYGELTPEALAFMVAHEYAHNLIDIGGSAPDPEWGARIREKGWLDGRFAKLGEDLVHENVDALAAKLLRHLGIRIDGGLLALRGAVDHYQLTEGGELYRRVTAERASRARVAYDEGWSAWSGYQRLLSPCATESGALYAFLTRVGAESLFRRIGNEPCRYFDYKTARGEFRRGHSRYREVYP